VVKESVAHLAQELKGFAWQNVRLLISAGAVDRRKVFYKTLEKAGRVEDHAALAEDCDWAVKAEQWAENLVQEQGKRIQANALAELVNRVGPNLRQLFNEAEKLVTYVGTRPQITLADVAAVSAHNKQAKAFALGDALGDRKLPELLQRLDEELWGMQFDRDRSEIGLLYGLVTKVRALIFAKEMLREGWLKPGDDYPRIKARLPQMPAAQWPADKRFNPASLNAYVLFKAMNQAKNFTQAELVRALELLLECNLRLVTTSEEEKRVMQQTLTAMVGQGGRWAG
jgi:DNA polymerase-3 subunit delta